MISEFSISIKSSSRGISISQNENFENFDGFIDFLEEKGISKVSLKYYSIIDDSPSFLKDCAGLNIEDLALWHVEWLSAKVESESRFLEIDYQSKKPYILEKNMMHKELMPFKEKHVKRFYNVVSQEKHIEYFKRSLANYRKYEEDFENINIMDFKQLRQAEKDERFFTTRYFTGLFLRDDVERNSILKKILVNSFGENPPIVNYSFGWDNLLKGEISLQLEADKSAPKEYKEYLSRNLNKRHFVPYVLDKGKSSSKETAYRIDLEGPTQVDAYIENKNTGLRIFIEAKYLSDISYDVSYDVSRNQIARNIDVMLENTDGRSLFLLLTPKYFKVNPHTRLYGYKMNDYMNNHLKLMADLCHRNNIEPAEWLQISKRIAWTTWEDLNIWTK